ncbi:Lrp/AsnC family transcriptional regulator [Mucilaginibacter jinjuensis]|uniref:Lrp/AsnC family transcriptional regulator n=1 Tax=Mucilaginibacter jinjuensis TaxID=1176721 RepID=A0ABY7TCB6_9SPHI|nr:Lrp/AsnC family transcriptional regulator [Mucilaginibacter jinjuensis]WCT14086.1 Lrp/AsnC family transcriptional regulator [Mucilaginibacter jinjuensis]
MPNTFDEIDTGILTLLQQNGHLTHKDIGEKLNKSPSTIQERVRRLQKEGYIKGYVAIIDHHKVGLGLICFTHIKIKDHLHENLSRFAEEIVKFGEVQECFKVSGEFDFILRIAAPDLASYDDFLANVISKIVPLGNMYSTFVLQEVKTGGTLPIGMPKKQMV